MIRSNGPRYVYFAMSGGMVKIGCSSRPAQRLIQISEWVPFKVSLAATMPGGFALEKALHQMFAAEWSHLEWFHVSERLMRFIGRVAACLPVEITTSDVTMTKDVIANAKKRVTRRVQAAEAKFLGTNHVVAIRNHRPLHVAEAMATYDRPGLPAPSPETIAVLEAYIADLIEKMTSCALERAA